MKTLTEQQKHYVEEVGLLVEQTGAQRSAGRVMAALLISAEPLSQEELMHMLELSRTSTSVALRWLEQLGFVQRCSWVRHRKRYYEVRPDMAHWLVSSTLRHMEQDVHLLRIAESVAEPGARERIVRMRELYAFLKGRLEAALCEWFEQHATSDSHAQPLQIMPNVAFPTHQ